MAKVPNVVNGKEVKRYETDADGNKQEVEIYTGIFPHKFYPDSKKYGNFYEPTIEFTSISTNRAKELLLKLNTLSSDYMYNDFKDINSMILWNQTMKRFNLTKQDDALVREYYNKLQMIYPRIVADGEVSTGTGLNLLVAE